MRYELQAFFWLTILLLLLGFRRYGFPWQRTSAYGNAMIEDLNRIANLPIHQRIAFFLILAVAGFVVWNWLLCLP